MNLFLLQGQQVTISMQLRGREVPMTEEHRVIGIMDSCRPRMSYQDAVRHTAQALDIQEELVRFYWIGWNQGFDSF